RKHDVVVEFLREPLVELDALVVKGDALRGAIVGADDGGVATAGAAPEIALVQDGDVGDAVVLAKVIGDGQSVYAGADNCGVVSRFQAVMAPHRLEGHGLLLLSPFSGRTRGGASTLRAAPRAAAKRCWC